MIERGGRSQEIGEGLREQARQMFHAWHRVRDGHCTHAQFRVTMRPIRRAVARLLKAGQTCGLAKTQGVCREVLKVYDALWTFVRVAGVEPTTCDSPMLLIRNAANLNWFAAGILTSDDNGSDDDSDDD